MRTFLFATFMMALLLPKPKALAADSSHDQGSITSVTPDLNQMRKWNGMKGDTADPFWADDDCLYHFTCDGPGFGKEGRNLCLNKLTGPDRDHLKGELVNSMDEYGKSDGTGPDGATWKICGQECIDGIFYGFVVRNIYGHKSKDPQMRQTSFNASLIKSTDHGKTWTRSAQENYDLPMWPGSRFGGPGFFHFGKNGGTETKDAADKYVYAVSNNGFWNGGDDMIVARVLRSDLPNLKASDWTYFTGGDGVAPESWNHDISKAQPVLKIPSKLGWTSPSYIPSLGRYLLVSWYVSPTLTSWFAPKLVTYDFYQAEHPWGPWSFVSSFNDGFFKDRDRHMYGPTLCAKYQEKVGNTFRIDLYTSGCPFGSERTGLYKNWRIPLILKTTPDAPQKEVRVDDPIVKYSGNWKTLRISTTPGDSIDFPFVGTEVSLLAEKSPWHGVAEVFIDGKSRGDVSLKEEDFPTLSKIPVFSVEGLTSGDHTLRLVNKGSDPIVLNGFSVVGIP
jgi:hypothetical protein